MAALDMNQTPLNYYWLCPFLCEPYSYSPPGFGENHHLRRAIHALKPLSFDKLQSEELAVRSLGGLVATVVLLSSVLTSTHQLNSL